MNEHITEAQADILRVAAQPSGPLISEGEIVLGAKHGRDIRVLTRLGLLSPKMTYRQGVGACYRITTKGRRLLERGEA